MSGRPWCDKCGELTLSGRHRCPPSWFVWSADHHDDDEPGDVVYAYSADGAAEQYTIIKGNPETVRVTPCAGGEPVWLEVYGESVPSYTATYLPSGRKEE